MRFQDSRALGPRKLDEDQLSKISKTSLHRYQVAVLRFSTWATALGQDVHSAEELDDLLVEWKASTSPTKTNFEMAVAGVEFWNPRWKGKLAWSHAIINGMAVSHQTRHTVPLTRGPARLMAVWLASRSKVRLGVGLLLQREVGLRPSEMLGLRPAALVFPEQQARDQQSFLTVCLGMKVGTKAKRPQVVVLQVKEQEDLVDLLRFVCKHTLPDELLFPFPYENYRREISAIECLMGVRVGWTPHSARAGFASESRAEGMDFNEIREKGRWLADSSLRVYIDISQAAQTEMEFQTAGLAPAIRLANTTYLRLLWTALSHDTAAAESKRLKAGYHTKK